MSTLVRVSVWFSLSTIICGQSLFFVQAFTNLFIFDSFLTDIMSKIPNSLAATNWWGILLIPCTILLTDINTQTLILEQGWFSALLWCQGICCYKQVKGELPATSLHHNLLLTIKFCFQQLELTLLATSIGPSQLCRQYWYDCSVISLQCISYCLMRGLSHDQFARMHGHANKFLTSGFWAQFWYLSWIFTLKMLGHFAPSYLGLPHISPSLDWLTSCNAF